MPITFPSSPTNGQSYTYSGNTWVWDGTSWNLSRVAAGPTGPQGPTGPTGATGATGPQGTSINVRASVATVGALPTTGNNTNDARIVDADGDLYIWDGSSWTSVGQIVGPLGPTGATGAQGPTGPTGAASTVTGPTGATGATGAQGPTGPTGAASTVAGPTGPQGAQGPTGPQGATGSQGPTGPQGATGLQGLTGSTGAQGPQGLTGATGAQGPTGPTGATGATGSTGAQGPAGPQGSTGATGATGASGSIDPYWSGTLGGQLLFSSGIGFTSNSAQGWGVSTATDFYGFSSGYRLGNTTYRWAQLYAQTSTISTSDQREKKDIEDSDLGLDFINDLRPVSYRHKVGTSEQVIDEDGNKVFNEDGTPKLKNIQPGVRYHYGLISQEVKTAIDAHTNKDYAAFVLADPSDPNSAQMLRYEELISPLIKAVQELSARVAALEQPN